MKYSPKKLLTFSQEGKQVKQSRYMSILHNAQVEKKSVIVNVIFVMFFSK